MSLEVSGALPTSLEKQKDRFTPTTAPGPPRLAASCTQNTVGEESLQNSPVIWGQ